MRRPGLQRNRLRRRSTAGDPRRRRRRSTSRSPAAPTRSPTRSSWPSSTPTRAGVFVSASAGNEGPGAGTANHLSPWVTTVAASTQTREFATTLTSPPATVTPSPSTGRRSPPAPARSRSCWLRTSPGYTDGAGLRQTAPTSGRRRLRRAHRRLPARRPGPRLEGLRRRSRAAARAWSSTTPALPGRRDRQPLGADRPPGRRHRLPRLHERPHRRHRLVRRRRTARRSGRRHGRRSRRVARPACSSSPTSPRRACRSWPAASPTREPPNPVDGGNPPGEFFQAIAGTSMSSPHVAGAGLLLRPPTPTGHPGQIKSALMTTATTDVVKEDLVTPADPFDMGAGRIDIGAAGDAPLTFSDTADELLRHGQRPGQRGPPEHPVGERSGDARPAGHDPRRRRT